MGKMTLEEVQAAARQLSEEEQELLYLALAVKMEEALYVSGSESCNTEVASFYTGVNVFDDRAV